MKLEKIMEVVVDLNLSLEKENLDLEESITAAEVYSQTFQLEERNPKEKNNPLLLKQFSEHNPRIFQFFNFISFSREKLALVQSQILVFDLPPKNRAEIKMVKEEAEGSIKRPGSAYRNRPNQPF